MTAKTDRIADLLMGLTAEETAEVAREVLGYLGLNQIIEIILEMDDDAKGEIAARLGEEEAE